jgi:hypothetical protein
MRAYLGKRLLLVIPTLLGVASVVFVIMRVIPGDVALLILGGDDGGRIDRAQLAAMHRQLGLDQPLHIVPNVLAPFIIIVTAQLGGAILAEAALSYLGLGTAEPTPSWGLMLSGSALSYAEKAPWIALFPGIAISLGVFGFNLFGDSLRDALDPKSHRG